MHQIDFSLNFHLPSIIRNLSLAKSPLIRLLDNDFNSSVDISEVIHDSLGKEKQMSEKIHFSYLRDPENDRRVMTVARRIEGEQIVFQTAVCNPKDHHTKKVGRQIATGRLEKHPWHVSREEGVHPMETISDFLLKEMSEEDITPFEKRIFEHHLLSVRD